MTNIVARAIHFASPLWQNGMFFVKGFVIQTCAYTHTKERVQPPCHQNICSTGTSKIRSIKCYMCLRSGKTNCFYSSRYAFFHNKQEGQIFTMDIKGQ